MIDSAYNYVDMINNVSDGIKAGWRGREGQMRELGCRIYEEAKKEIERLEFELTGQPGGYDRIWKNVRYKLNPLNYSMECYMQLLRDEIERGSPDA